MQLSIYMLDSINFSLDGVRLLLCILGYPNLDYPDTLVKQGSKVVHNHVCDIVQYERL